MLNSNNNWQGNYDRSCAWSNQYLWYSGIFQSCIWVISFIEPWLAADFSVHIVLDKYPQFCITLLLTVLSYGLFPRLPTGCLLESNCNSEYLITFTISNFLKKMSWKSLLKTSWALKQLNLRRINMLPDKSQEVIQNNGEYTIVYSPLFWINR